MRGRLKSKVVSGEKEARKAKGMGLLRKKMEIAWGGGFR